MSAARCRAALAAALGLLAACATRGPALPEAPSGPPAMVLLVSVAGLTPDRYLGASAEGMPALRTLAAAGVAAEAVETVAPASSYPAHATLLTGRRPAAHGIVADRLIGERGVRLEGYWHASRLRAATLWQVAVEVEVPVASLGWPTTVGAAIPLLIPDAVPTRRGETWLQAIADSATPSLVERARVYGGAKPEADVPGPLRDEVLGDVACDLLRAPAPPRLLLLHLSQTAPALALHGPDSAEAAAAFARVDDEIEALVGCLRRAGRLPAAALVVVGDHGTAPIHTFVAPNAVLARAGLIEGDALRIERWNALSRSNGGSAFVYARNERAAVSARLALDAESRESGAFRIVSADEMLQAAADPDAWFGIEAEPGYAFEDRHSGPFERAAAWRGIGGYLPDYAAMNAGFVAWGRGVRREVRVPLMRQTDVAPTLARMLGVELPDTHGRVLIGALAFEGETSVSAPPAPERGAADVR